MNGMRRKEYYALVGAMAAAVLLFFLIRPAARTALAEPRLLRAVGLENTPGLRRIAYTEWTDRLQYCSGYEIAAFSVDGDRFDPPAGWETPDEPVGLEAFNQTCHIDLYLDEIRTLLPDAGDCVAWRFVDHRDEAVPFDRRDYYLAFCCRTGGRDRLFIYRGHHLYGWDD